MNAQTSEYRVEFYWTNSKGTKKTAMTIVAAVNKSAAVRVARTQVMSEYGLSVLRLKSVALFSSYQGVTQ